MEIYLTQISNYLLRQSWQIILLVMVIGAASLAMRNKSAHVRYLLWLIVLAKCLIPLQVTVPVAILPQEISAPVLETATIPKVELLPLPSTPVFPSPARNAAVKTAGLSPRQWLGLAWIVGVAIFIFVAIIKALRTHFWLRQKRKPLGSELQTEIEGLFSGLRIRSFPKIWLVEGISQPFVWGLLRGGIYLPDGFVKVDNTEFRKGILGHELSHVLRFDVAVNILQVIAQTLFWFHPFVWWANKRIRAEREKCCDETAIASLNTKVKDYSRAIIETLVTEYESTRSVPSLAVAGPVKNIEERIKILLRPGKKFQKRPTLLAALVVVLIAFLTVPTALVLTARADSKAVGGDKALTRKSTEGAYKYTPASDPNLVAWWRLDDGSGSIARDSSGNDNHGKLQGDPQWTKGKIGGALDFDGKGDYVDCGNPDIFNFDKQVTVGAWINLRSIPGVHRAIVAKGEDAWRIALTRRTPGLHFAVAGRALGYPGTYSATQVTFGEWHHVCGTYDGETIRLYVDGQIDGTFDYTHGIATNNFNLLIGDNPQSPSRYFWDGLIDEVFVFNRALSNDEIRVVMQGLSGSELARKPDPADRIKTNSVGMKLVWIPPGEFMMGSKFQPQEVTRRYGGSPVRYQNEHPRRKVTLTRGFWMAQSEVTQEQYHAVMGSNPSKSKGSNLPVEMVSWHDAMEFCGKLSEKEGKTYTLPTEAQWEYAARAGTDTAYYFGDDADQLSLYAWYGNNSWGKHPVKRKKPNAFDLYDMYGNVWEWCLDWYQGSYNGLGNVDPGGPQSGQTRVARGGAGHVYAGPYRSAVREGYNPDARNRYPDVGFRVVMLKEGID